MGGLLISIFVGVVMASATMFNGHGVWWALVHYSAAGTLTFLLFLALVLRFARNDDLIAGAAQTDLQDGLYRVAPVSFQNETS